MRKVREVREGGETREDRGGSEGRELRECKEGRGAEPVRVDLLKVAHHRASAVSLTDPWFQEEEAEEEGRAVRMLRGQG